MSWTRKPAAQGAWGEGKGGAFLLLQLQGQFQFAGHAWLRERGRVYACSHVPAHALARARAADMSAPALSRRAARS